MLSEEKGGEGGERRLVFVINTVGAERGGDLSFYLSEGLEGGVGRSQKVAAQFREQQRSLSLSLPLFTCGEADRSYNGKRCSSCCWDCDYFLNPCNLFLGVF